MGRNPANWRFCRIRRCRWKPGWTLDYVDTEDKRHQAYAGLTAEDAVALKTRLIREGRVKAHQPTTPLLARFVETWLAERADGNVAESTLARDRRRLRARILPKLGHLALGEIGHETLLGYRAEALRTGTPANWNHDRALLSAMFTSAVARGILPQHPIKGRIPSATETVPERRVLTELEQVRLLDALRQIDAEQRGDAWGYPYYLVAFDTAARPGAQISRLEWRDLDFEAGTILFRRPKGGKRPKARDLTATMTPRLQVALQARLAMPRSAIYVFPGSSPHRPLVNHLKRFQAALVRAGLPREIVPYSARHTALTNLANAGLPTKDIRDAAGHARISTTERYLHAGRGVGEKVAAILGAVGETPQAKAKRITG